ncbi:MAG: hypothetical protein GX896_01980 [Clostridiales bacterium]|nr:hypothetical protein [Clostridiales bacterium]
MKIKKLMATALATVAIMSATCMNASAASANYIRSYSGKEYVISGKGTVICQGAVTRSSTTNRYTVKSSTGLNTQSGGASISTVIYYYDANGNYKSTGNGNGGQNGALTLATAPANVDYLYARNTHMGYGVTVLYAYLYY